MLVLTRRTQQSIMIGEGVVITILEVRGDQVRIGVSAPRDVAVHREEVFLELQEANKSAASPSADAISALGSLLAAPDSDDSDDKTGPGSA
jgi:carbon storage regulator